jgi:hypothetical protein
MLRVAVLRTVLALVPLAAVPVLLTLLADGRLDLGGGEMDLVWLIPWTLWSLVFAVSSFVLGSRGWSIARSVLRSTLVGLAAVLAGALLLAAFGQLGVAGRF